MKVAKLSKNLAPTISGRGFSLRRELRIDIQNGLHFVFDTHHMRDGCGVVGVDDQINGLVRLAVEDLAHHFLRLVVA